MSRRPAAITQADVARIIRAAKQTGTAEIEVRLGGSLDDMGSGISEERP
jgi:hypothetical protein